MSTDPVYIKTENSKGDRTAIGDMEKSRVQFKEHHSHSIPPWGRTSWSSQLLSIHGPLQRGPGVLNVWFLDQQHQHHVGSC